MFQDSRILFQDLMISFRIFRNTKRRSEIKNIFFTHILHKHIRTCASHRSPPVRVIYAKLFFSLPGLVGHFFGILVEQNRANDKIVYFQKIVDHKHFLVNITNKCRNEPAHQKSARSELLGSRNRCFAGQERF